MPLTAAEEKIKAAANKELGLMMGSCSPLEGDNFHVFQKKLKRFANAYDWPTHILDSDEILDQAAIDALTFKEKCDIRNAYLLMMDKTDDHTVTDALEECEEGDAQEAFKLIREFFYPNDQGGRNTSAQTFWTATMANTDTTVVQWSALVTSNANMAKAAGLSVSEADQLTIFLNGLLPEFNNIKLLLEQNKKLTLKEARASISSHATSHKLKELTIGGGKHVKANTFSVTDQPPRGRLRNGHKTGKKRSIGQCNRWTNADCEHGDKCIFDHNGPGGCHPNWKELRREWEANRDQNKARNHPPPNRSTPNAPSAFMAEGRNPARAK